jgi:hypothetical protein
MPVEIARQIANRVCGKQDIQFPISLARHNLFWLIMNDADARRQTPGLQINNPGGMSL